MFKLKAKARRIELSLDYQGADPRKVPTGDLKEICQSPIAGEDTVVNEYRARIKNRSTAIRAYCVSCMSGQPGLVRTCTAVTCILWPFRMGADPFRGKDIPKMHVELDHELNEDEADENFVDEDDAE